MFVKIILAVFFFVFSGVFHPLYAAGPAMVEKDLFSVDRKAPPLHSEDSDSKAGGQEMAIGNIELDGVIIRDNVKKALLRIKNTPFGEAGARGKPLSPYIVLREGGTVSGYLVIKIEYKRVSLQKDGKTYTIGLFANNKKGAASSHSNVATAHPRSIAAPRVQPRGAGGPPGPPSGIPKLPRSISAPAGFNPGPPPKAPPDWKPPARDPNIPGHN